MEKTAITSLKEETGAGTIEESDKEAAEIKLVENAFVYITEKRYPLECSKNEKLSIRRKAERLQVKDGDLLYKKKDGNEVRASHVR